ncbi:hypothetical protein DLAC_00236 [Tieghemostelium lacteum]|uniref:Uncharacterized protein n=1 Tax=Tieghemostelium lacteum TaxID=361077 RepID=A0A152A974_TIELA|nr:hypothetical protein DLAC_00236 [Tieghemostelium lacteum]|eukprot:KYR02773.1 hypothetical protein DLAC_00236 [Tieghemostelium lacteum]
MTVNTFKCENNLHQKSTELVCLECNLTVCSKCIKLHPSHLIVDQDEISNEMFGSDNVLPLLIEKRNNQKSYDTNIFENTVKEVSNNEIESLSKHFTTTRNLLKVKEENIKNTLKENYDENLKKFNDFVQTNKQEIEWSYDLLKVLDNPNPDTEDKVKFIQHYLMAEHLMENYGDLGILEYDVSHLIEKKDNLNEIIKTEINSTSLVCNTASVVKTEKQILNTILTFNYENGIEMYNMSTKTHTNVAGFTLNVNHPKSSDELLYQNASCPRDSFYFFNRNSYWSAKKIRGLDYSWNKGELSDPTATEDKQSILPSLSKLSTMFDGKSTIFLFGGYNSIDKSQSSQVSRFNIISEKFEILGDILLEPKQDIHLSLDVDAHHIYLIGGTSKAKTHHNTVDRFNTLTRKIERFLQIPKEIGDISGGCYCPLNKTIYLLSSDSRFHSYNTETKDYYQLNQPYEHTEIVKFLYDGQDTIYIINDYSLFQIYIYSFNIISKEWNLIPYEFGIFAHSSYFSLIK